MLELRRAGVTFDQIAKSVGYTNKGTAYEAYRRALTRTLQQPADEVRELELDRLDRAQTAIWASVMQGDPAAVNTLLKIMDRRSKYLGLDAPVKQQVEIAAYDGGTDIDREVERLADTLRRVGRGSPVPVEGAAGTP